MGPSSYCNLDPPIEGSLQLSFGLPPLKMEGLAPLLRRSKIGNIVSFINKRRNIDTFERPPYNTEELAAEDELFNRSLDQTHVFTYKQLKKATNGFRREIGTGGFGTVYLGQLQDNRMVAVKVLYDRNKKRREQFINEVLLLSRFHHQNLVNLYGCTNPQTDPGNRELILVYEFVPNGTLADHLHGLLHPLSWSRRLQIAVETAEALWYLHSVDTPVVHRDVKPENILLDNAFHVKVADFGMSRFLPSDGTHLSTVTPGTQGYHDPEYENIYMLTDKSDVYSFGVVLIELISRERAVDVKRAPDNVYLAGMAYKKIINKELEQLVDPELGYHFDDGVRRTVDLIAELACTCLQQRGNMRPSMLEVLNILKAIKSDVQHLEEGQDRSQEAADAACYDSEANLMGPSMTEEVDAIDCFSEARLKGNLRPFKKSPSTFMMKTPSTSMMKIFEMSRPENNKVLSLPYVFSYEELEEATNCFDAAGEISNDMFHRTFLGILRDGQTVLVRVPNANIAESNTRRRFKNEVTTLSCLRHQNVIALYGYTNPDTKKLLTVYEFVCNGTLKDHIFGQRLALPLAVRIQIAVEIAEALVYLHSPKISIMNNHLTASNILLDDNFHVKLTGLNFYYSLRGDTTDKAMSVYCPTDEYDVHCFGLILLVLTMGKRALNSNPDWVPRAILIHQLDQMADPELELGSSPERQMMLNLINELAFKCLRVEMRFEESKRPSMMEVLIALKDIRDGTQRTYDTNWLERWKIREPDFRPAEYKRVSWVPDEQSSWVPDEDEQSSWVLTEGR